MINKEIELQIEMIKDLQCICFITDLSTNIIYKNDYLKNYEDKSGNKHFSIMCINSCNNDFNTIKINEKIEYRTLFEQEEIKVAVKRISLKVLLFSTKTPSTSIENASIDVLKNVATNYQHHIYSVYNVLPLVSQALEENGNYDEIRYVNMMSNECHQALKLSLNIQKYNELSSKDYVAVMDEVSLRKVLIDIKTDVERVLTKKEIEFITNIEKGAFFCQIPESEITTLLLNIVSNSAYFSNSSEDVQSRIELSISMIGESILITIKDNGIGIKKENLHLVTEPFFSYNPATQRQKGIGLGLTNAKKLLEKYNGSIMISSVENIGTTVSIRIPVLKELRGTELNSNNKNKRMKYGGLTEPVIFLSDSVKINLF